MRLRGLGRRFGVARIYLNRRSVTGSRFVVELAEDNKCWKVENERRQLMRRLAFIFLGLSVFENHRQGT